MIWMHVSGKIQITSTKLQTNSKYEISMTKTDQATKRRKKHKNKNSDFVISIGYKTKIR